MKIGLISPGPQDATSWYRGVLPWVELAKQRRHIVETIAEMRQWHELADFDVVVAQRPMLPPHRGLVERAYKLNIPIIVDFDDDHFNLPPWNGMYNVFEQPSAKESAMVCASLAKVVITSTPWLQEVYKKFNQNTIVIPNAWPDRVMGQPNFDKMLNRDKLVMWRTTGSQRGDHHLFPDGLIPLLQQDVKFLSFGDTPFFEDYIPGERMTKYPWMDTLEYFNLLRQISPTVALKPMKEHVFNRGKSNIAWLEAAYAGAVTVAPDWAEWKVPGCIRYNSEKSFKDAVAEAVNLSNEDRIKMLKSAWDYISKNLLLSKVNQTRQSLLEKL